MSLIIENGTGLANAESYIAVTAATAYHASLGNAAWAALASDTIREQLLRKATGYMQQTYNGRWKGVQATSTQALDWPRVGVLVNGWVVPNLTIPVDLANACAELALRAASADLSPDVGPQVTSETVGSISVSYAVGARQTTAFKAVDNLLAKYLTGGHGAIPVVRA